MSRTKKTIINSGTGLILNIVSMCITFLLRGLFIRLLGLEYAGVDSLFTDILKILNLADMGISNAILFRLYKTIATKDEAGTEKYVALYKKVCYATGIFVGVAGAAFIPFLEFFVKEKPAFSEPLWSLYVIIIGTSVVSHFINYRGVLFTAHQDRYINIILQYVCEFLKHGLQIVSLLVFRNIYLYLIVGLFTTLLHGLLSKIFSEKKYHISWKSKEKLSKEESSDILKDVGALAVFKFCRTLHVTIDTFLISKFISVATTAIYGSVAVITTALSNLLSTLNDGMIASVGDLHATGDDGRLHRVFQMSSHLIYLLYGTCVVVLAPLLGVFTTWWVGHTLPDTCLYVMLFNFYVAGYNSMVSTFRNATGLYRQGWKRPAVTMVLNFGISLILIQKIGLIGALLGTAISNILTIVWYDPYIVYKYIFKESPLQYFAKYLMYLLIVAGTSIMSVMLGKILPVADTFLSLLWHGIVYTVFALAVLLLFGMAFPAQKELIQKGMDLLKLKLKK